MKNSVLKVMNMNSALTATGKFFFNYGVDFYFGYAYFVLE